MSRVCCSRVALLILPMSSPASLSPPPDANAPSPPPVPGILITKVRVARQRARDDCSLCWSNRNVAEIAVWLNFVERILSFFLFSCSPAANAADGTERGEQEGEAALKRSHGRRRGISVRSQKQFSLSLSLSLSLFYFENCWTR